MLVSLASIALSATQRPAGLFIHAKSALVPAQYADATEYVSAEKFQTVVNLTTADGAQISIETPSIHERLEYEGKRPEAFPELLRESDLAPLEVAIKSLNGVAGRYPKSQRLLVPFIADLKREAERFRQGQGKWSGRWYPTRQAANEERERPLRLAAVQRQKETAAAIAQEQQLQMVAQKDAADREAAVAEENAAARDFHTRSAALFAKFLDDPSWKGHSDDLSKITRLSPSLEIQFAALTDSGKKLHSRFKHHDSRSLCEKTFPLLEVPTVWALAAESFVVGEAAKGTVALKDFLSRRSGAECSDIAPVWNSLLAFYKSCREREGAAQSHLQRAKELSATGKTAQAVKEYEMAQGIYPDQETLRTIEKLRKESLGL